MAILSRYYRTAVQDEFSIGRARSTQPTPDSRYGPRSLFTPRLHLELHSNGRKANIAYGPSTSTQQNIWTAGHMKVSFDEQNRVEMIGVSYMNFDDLPKTYDYPGQEPWVLDTVLPIGPKEWYSPPVQEE